MADSRPQLKKETEYMEKHSSKKNQREALIDIFNEVCRIPKDLFHLIYSYFVAPLYTKEGKIINVDNTMTIRDMWYEENTFYIWDNYDDLWNIDITGTQALDFECLLSLRSFLCNSADDFDNPDLLYFYKGVIYAMHEDALSVYGFSSSHETYLIHVESLVLYETCQKLYVSEDSIYLSTKDALYLYANQTYELKNSLSMLNNNKMSGDFYFNFATTDKENWIYFYLWHKNLSQSEIYVVQKNNFSLDRRWLLNDSDHIFHLENMYIFQSFIYLLYPHKLKIFPTEATNEKEDIIQTIDLQDQDYIGGKGNLIVISNTLFISFSNKTKARSWIFT